MLLLITVMYVAAVLVLFILRSLENGANALHMLCHIRLTDHGFLLHLGCSHLQDSVALEFYHFTSALLKN
jgi:hypothetical protein